MRPDYPINQIVNKVLCLNCGDKIVSIYRHDYNSCSCGNVSVDGGMDYLRIVGDGDCYNKVTEPLTESEIEAGNKRMGKNFDKEAYHAKLRELNKR